MEKYFVKDTIKLESLRDVLKLLVKVKSISKGYKLSDSFLNLVVDFHLYGFSKDTYNLHIEKSLTDSKNYFKSIATIDNSKTYLRKIGIIDKGVDSISLDYLPSLTENDSCYLTLMIYHD